MLRMSILILSMVGIGLLTSASPAEAPATMKPGETYKGKLQKKGKFGIINLPEGFLEGVPIKMKEGQGVTISVTVVGDGREVTIFLADPDNKVVKCSSLESGNAKITVKQVTVLSGESLRSESHIE